MVTRTDPEVWLRQADDRVLATAIEILNTAAADAERN